MIICFKGSSCCLYVDIENSYFPHREIKWLEDLAQCSISFIDCRSHVFLKLCLSTLFHDDNDIIIILNTFDNVMADRMYKLNIRKC